MSNLKNKLRGIISERPSNWKKKAQNRKNNPWLREYSSKIARRILSIIEDNKDLNQVKLAQTIDVSPQQISKIVKGQENLTLETIYKLSKALKYELISFPDYKYSTNYNQSIISSSNFTDLKNTAFDVTDFKTMIFYEKRLADPLSNEVNQTNVFVLTLVNTIAVNKHANTNG